ncbi:hypothetical protein DFH27DRAFT_610690 [Peziza echinospora]|nr:hypothetical protein DFH27DRAFT_610690 [Peziza echinospora]
MATGFEVVGVVLAVFPLVCKAVKKCVETSDAFIHHQHTLNEFHRVLRVEKVDFESSCVRAFGYVTLAEKLQDSETNWTEMDWLLEGTLRKEVIPEFLQAVTVLKDLVEELNRRFRFMEGSKARSWIGKFCNKVKVSMLAPYCDTQLKSIKEVNGQLKTLITGGGPQEQLCGNGDEALATAPPRLFRKSALFYNRVREHAITHYTLWLDTLKSNCTCPSEHTVGLQLEQRAPKTGLLAKPQLDAGFKFRFMFTLPTDSILHEPIASWNYRQLEIEHAEDSVPAAPPPPTATVVLGSERGPPISPVPQKRPKRNKEVTFKAVNTEAFLDALTHCGQPLVPLPKEFSGLCWILEEEITNSTCHGIIRNCNGGRYSVNITLQEKTHYSLISIPPALDSGRTISLAQLFAHGASRAHIEKPSQRNLAALALTLALSVIQLHETDWLGEVWGKEDIIFFVEPDRDSNTAGGWRSPKPRLSMPMLRRQFSTTGATIPPSSSCSIVHPKSGFCSCNKSLFSLGVVLIELVFWRGLETLFVDVQDPKNPIPAVPWTDTKAKDAFNALFEMIWEGTSKYYVHAVMRCLNWQAMSLNSMKPGSGRRLEEADFKMAVLSEIIFPIQQNLSLYNTTSKR